MLEWRRARPKTAPGSSPALTCPGPAEHRSARTTRGVPKVPRVFSSSVALCNVVRGHCASHSALGSSCGRCVGHRLISFGGVPPSGRTVPLSGRADVRARSPGRKSWVRGWGVAKRIADRGRRFGALRRHARPRNSSAQARGDWKRRGHASSPVGKARPRRPGLLPVRSRCYRAPATEPDSPRHAGGTRSPPSAILRRGESARRR